ncbi:MAG: acyltransferase [bacterium]|nr:acyltransferase [bacterium]
MKMTFWKKIIAYIVSIPARMKGVEFGKNSFLGFGYDTVPKLKGVILGNDVMIGKNAWLDISLRARGAKIIIGNGTQIGRFVVLSACDKIEIGEKCLVSYNVSFIDHDHNFSNIMVSPMDSGITEGEEIEIGDHCFIGAHSFILKGVTLGKHCVVGANSVVVDSFPDCSVVAGNPAKLVKNLNANEN